MAFTVKVYVTPRVKPITVICVFVITAVDVIRYIASLTRFPELSTDFVRLVSFMLYPVITEPPLDTESQFNNIDVSDNIVTDKLDGLPGTLTTPTSFVISTIEGNNTAAGPYII